MENAVKALIIAGSVIVTILVISLGISIYNSNSDVTDDANSTMWSTAAFAFNQKFTRYFSQTQPWRPPAFPHLRWAWRYRCWPACRRRFCGPSGSQIRRLPLPWRIWHPAPHHRWQRAHSSGSGPSFPRCPGTWRCRPGSHRGS